MERTLQQGLQISQRNFQLYRNMAYYLLPRWHGQPGDVAEFARQMREQIKGDDGLEVVACLARGDALLGRGARRFFGRRPGGGRAGAAEAASRRSAHAEFCLLAGLQAGRSRAGQADFPRLGRRPDFSLWTSRKEYDQLRTWADPAIPRPNEFLPADGEESANLQAYTDESVFVGFLPDNKTLVTGSTQLGSLFKVWDFERQQLVKDFSVFGGGMDHADFRVLDDGAILVRTLNSEGLYCINAKQPDYATEPGYLCELGYPILFASDDMKVDAIYVDGKAVVVDDREKKRFAFKVERPTHCRISPDGKYLFGIDAGKVHLWEILRDEEVVTFQYEGIQLVKFAEASTNVMYANGEKLILWNLAEKRERLSIPIASPNLFTQACTTRDLRYLAAAERRIAADGSEQSVAVLWDVEAGKPVHTFEAAKRPILGMCFSRDGRWLATGLDNGVVKVWDVAKVTGESPAAPETTETAADSKSSQ